MPNEFQLAVAVAVVYILLLWLWVFLAWLLLAGEFLMAGAIASILLPTTLAIVQRAKKDWNS